MDSQACFFCGQPIIGNRSREHIFGDKFLQYLDLKQTNLASSLANPTTYSRIKVPAHATCNNEVGSEFENQMLGLIKSMDQNLELLSKLHMPSAEPLNTALREAFVHWVAKLYYGLLYWEAGLRNHQKPEYQQWLQGLLASEEFAYLRKCFMQRLAFRIPSSVFHFHLPEPQHSLRFDFGNGLPLGLIYVRFRQHLIVASVGDACLVQQWFTAAHVASAQAALSENSSEEPLAYLHAVAHIWAVREWLPIAPRLEYGESAIRDRSREGHPVPPEIDAPAVNERAAEVYAELAAKWRGSAASSYTEVSEDAP
ncbi:hypothetical protein [Steroidobacter cummioxidans]|uniref:hypothetical protein n=1 Tax=Steroidobacter cummioxidans TaxID=1803913 RepID=UPI000E30D81C|nr:hypothetical protein [Steroidobacter cummioxidans]